MPVAGETSSSRSPPHAATGSPPNVLESARSLGGEAMAAHLFAAGSYAAAAAGHGGNPGSTTTRARPSHTPRGSQSRIGAAGILTHRPRASC